MKKHFIHTIISVMLFWGAYSPAAALSAEDNQSFLDMINQIRTAPYDYAIDLGYTPGELSAKGILPETPPVAPYTLDPNLNDTAADESKLMAGEKIAESTISPVYRLTASTGGVVSFFNFMPRDTAFKIVIDYLFKKELDLDNESPRYILSKEYSSAGIAISAGKVGSGNAWFVAIKLASPELVSEIQMLNLINQVRANVNMDIIKEYTGLDLADAYELNRNIIYLFNSEYKPLFFDASLSAAARAHLSETQTDLEMDVYHGYEGEVVQEFDMEVPEEDGRSVDRLFSHLIYMELIDWPMSMSHVTFLKDVQNVGSNIAFQPGDNNKMGTSVLSFVVGKYDQNTSNDENADNNTEQTSRIYGILFSDNDGNDLYSPGEEEGCIQKTVTVYNDGMQEVESVVTDNAGHFSVRLPTNQQYHFVATINGVEVREDENDGFITSDKFIGLGYSPPSVEETGSLETGQE